MEIKQARFLMSNTDISKCPNDNKPEYAFIGRSNVGKSSLINMITRNSKLAKTSSKPGKTQHINHFIINEEWYLVDLPGYGYAKVGKTLRQGFSKINMSYIEKRDQLTCMFVLVDIRHDPMSIDIEFITMLGEMGVPFSIIFTKRDKIKKEALKISLENYKNELLKYFEELPPMFTTSATKELGKDELLDYIESINQTL